MRMASARMRWMVGVSMVVGLSCSTVKKMDLEPTLDTPDEPRVKVVHRIKVAVLRFQEPAPPLKAPGRDVAPGSGSDGAVSKAPALPVAKPPDPPLPGTRVDFTSKYAEQYPSTAHMMSSVPAALMELGFDVIRVQSLREAKDSGATMILELMPPEVEGFRTASGGGLTLEGSSTDLHVHYRARVTTPSGQKMGLISGHGESSTHFLFVDPHVEVASVGLVSLGLAAIASMVVGLPSVVLFAYLFTHRINPLGICDSSRLPPQREGINSVDVCLDMVALLVQTALVGLVVAVASGTVTVTQFLTNRVFTGVTSTIKRIVTGPRWDGTIKSAHDRAARSLADSTVLAVGQVGRLPPPVVSAVAPEGAQDG